METQWTDCMKLNANFFSSKIRARSIRAWSVWSRRGMHAWHDEWHDEWMNCHPNYYCFHESSKQTGWNILVFTVIKNVIEAAASD